MQQRFHFESVDTGDAITRHLREYETILRAGAGLFNASPRVSRMDWQRFVADLKVQQNFPGIQGLGFSLVIPPALLDSHVTALRQEGFDGYSVLPEGVRETYTAIIYLEPFDWRNQRAFGYDMFSEAIRREAMVPARDSGQPAV